MDVKSIAGIAKSRWWVLVLAGVLAVGVTSQLAAYQQDNLITHEAVTSITFVEDPTNLERGDFEQFLSEQHILAEGANRELLGQTPGPFLPWETAEIHLANDQNQLIFIGRGYSQEEANAVAQALRDQFLAVSNVGSGVERMSQELDELTQQIKQLREEISQRQASSPLTDEQTIQETQRTSLQTRIASLTAQLGALNVELLNPVERPASAVQAEMDRVNQELIRLNLELNALPPPPVDAAVEATQDEQFLLDQLRLTQLETRWSQLYNTLAELDDQASVGEVIAQEPTITVTSGRTNQALALVGAVVVALLALVAIERTRGIVWSKSEFKDDVAVIAELPPRQLHPFRRPSTDPWYVTVPTGRRKAAVQLIRSQMDAYQNIVVAFQGTGVFESDTLDLTADIAMSAAVSGRNTLLIDATFSDRATQVEYGPLQPDVTLMSILADFPPDPHMAVTEIKSTLLSLENQHRNLWSLRSGAGSLDAGDVLASQRFELLLDVARENFDIVIIAGDGYDEPTSHILAQRADAAVLVGSIGHTVDRQVEAAERDFRARRATLLGIVMLRRRRSRLKRWLVPGLRRRLWRAVDWLKSSKAQETDTVEVADEQSVTAVAAALPVVVDTKAAEREAAERAAAQAAETAAIEAAVAERAAAEAAEREAAEKAAAEAAEREAAEKAAAEAAEREAAEKAAAEAAEAAAAAAAIEQAAAEQAAAEQAAAEAAEAEKLAVAAEAEVEAEPEPKKPAAKSSSRSRKTTTSKTTTRSRSTSGTRRTSSTAAKSEGTTGSRSKGATKDSEPEASVEEVVGEATVSTIAAATVLDVDLVDEVVDVTTTLDDQEDKAEASSHRFRDRLRAKKESEEVITGFQSKIERFGVSDPRNLADPFGDADQAV
jgi:hypothetical protein